MREPPTHCYCFDCTRSCTFSSITSTRLPSRARVLCLHKHTRQCTSAQYAVR